MAIIVREAQLPADRHVLLDTLLRNRNRGDNALRQARFEWSYFNNPYGKPRAWLAIDESSGKVIGMAGAFPRRVLVNGKSVLCWNTGDFSIDQKFRTLGAAVKLRRAEKECVDRGEMAFLYCYPMDRMRVVLERVGHEIVGKIPRHRIILRIDHFVDQLMGEHLLSSALARLANPLLLAWWGNFCCRKDLTVRLQSQMRFGDEYDDLFERAGKKYAVITVRDSTFLTWRFLQNPLNKEIAILRLEAEGRLRGYAVLEVGGVAGRVLDFLVDDDIGAMRPFLGAIVRLLRTRGVSTLALRATDSNPIVRDLRSFGLIFRDTQDSGVMAYTTANSSHRSVLDEGNWFMTQADRDV